MTTSYRPGNSKLAGNSKSKEIEFPQGPCFFSINCCLEFNNPHTKSVNHSPGRGKYRYPDCFTLDSRLIRLNTSGGYLSIKLPKSFEIYNLDGACAGDSDTPLETRNSLLSIERNWIWLGAPAHGIVTKSVPNSANVTFCLPISSEISSKSTQVVY